MRAVATLAMAALIALPAAGQAPMPAPVAASAAAPAPADTGVPVSGAPAASVSQDYRLGVADKVRIIVFNEPTLSGEFYVNANGALSLPLIGSVPARGSTPSEIAAVIQTRLANGYLKSPQVSIDVLTFRPFYILGEVGKPGEYPYSAGLTVLQAVATAQGFTYRANKRKAFIKHPGQAGAIEEKLTPDLEVQPGDTVRIGERHF